MPLADNSAADQGGGVRSVTSTLDFSNTSITNNTAGSAGGGIYVTSTTLAIHGGQINGNHANSGGGIYLTNFPAAVGCIAARTAGLSLPTPPSPATRPAAAQQVSGPAVR